MSSISRHIVLCNGASASSDVSTYDSVVELDYRSGSPTQNIVITLPDFIRGVYHLRNRIADLLEIAAYVYSVDRLVSRGSRDAVEYHRWSGRALHFAIKVRDYDFWSQPVVADLLSSALEFVTGDHEYRFNFEDGHKTSSTGLFDNEQFEITADPGTSIVLFSGGIDSLTGAVERLSKTGDKVCLVSHRSSQPGTVRTQDRLVKALKERFPGRLLHYKFSCNFKSPTKAREETQRSRSFLYTAIAFALSDALTVERFIVYENGVTGINLRRRQSEINARTSRTTHPKTLAALESFYSLFRDEGVRIENPFLWNTKTDVMAKLESLGQAELLPSAVSCGISRRGFGSGSTHCGCCSQCIDRRFAAYASGLYDLDHSGLYDFDFVTDTIVDRQTRLALIDYVRQAKHTSEQNIDAFYEEWIDELVEVVPTLPNLSEEEAVEYVYGLYDRHATQLQAAIRQMRAIHEDPYETIPEGSFLEIVNRRAYLRRTVCTRELIERLRAVETGGTDSRKYATEYEEVLEPILKVLFSPHLSNPESQVASHDERERIDITFDNVAESGFWHDVKLRHFNAIVIFEAKNKASLDNDDFFQIAARLNSKRGLLGFLVGRSKSELDEDREYRRMDKGEIVLVLTDDDLITMLNLVEKGEESSDFIRDKYNRLLKRM